jgi:hypothetical protein
MTATCITRDEEKYTEIVVECAVTFPFLGQSIMVHLRVRVGVVILGHREWLCAKRAMVAIN